MLNRLTKRVYPAPGGQETFSYDAASRLRHWQRTGGIGVDYDYDDANRLTGLACAATGDEVGFSYDDLNRVATMTDASGTTTYTYTLNSLLQSVTRPGNRTLTYGYDLADRLKTLTDPEGLVTNYTYNDRDELTDVTLDGQTVHYQHDLLGRPTVTAYPNGMTMGQTFDERDRLLTRSYAKGGSPLLTLKHAYNQLGQKVLNEQITGRGTDLRRYEYTDRRELESSERTVCNGTSRRGVTTRRVYQFDANQNRTRAGNVTAAHNDADQLTATSDGQSFAHNGAGQMTEAGNWTFTYNHAEQIKTAQKTGVNATYVHDGNGLRVQKRVSSSAGLETTDYLWAGAEVLKEYTGMGAARATYLLGAGREGIKTDQGWQFYLRDALGSTVMTTDASGEIASQFEYGDWGETTQVFGSSSQYNPYRYTGQQFDGESGLYYLRARSYAPGLGRFTSRDPIGSDGGQNLYGYAGGDPVNLLDPSGLEPAPVTILTPFAPAWVNRAGTAAGVTPGRLTSSSLLDALQNTSGLLYTFSHSYSNAPNGPITEGYNMGSNPLGVTHRPSDELSFNDIKDQAGTGRPNIVFASGCRMCQSPLEAPLNLFSALYSSGNTANAVMGWDARTNVLRQPIAEFDAAIISGLVAGKTAREALNAAIASFNESNPEFADFARKNFRILGNPCATIR